ncbi:MAG TPA: helix-turn-helix domain-containing protein [Streptosporangiaceae bacterium]
MPAGSLSRPRCHLASRARPPGAHPGRFVLPAARRVHQGKRLDMQGIADELGVSRATLFRHVGGREALLGEALWLLTGTLDAAACGGRPSGRTADWTSLVLEEPAYG